MYVLRMYELSTNKTLYLYVCMYVYICIQVRMYEWMNEGVYVCIVDVLAAKEKEAVIHVLYCMYVCMYVYASMQQQYRC